MKNNAKKIIIAAVTVCMLIGTVLTPISVNATEENWFDKTVISDEDPFCNSINELSMEYSRAKEIYGVGDNYTEESRTAMEYAFSNAEKILDGSVDASDDEISTAIQMLQDAIANLNKPDVDTSKLYESIQKAEYFDFRGIRFTEETFRQFQIAYETAKREYYYGQTQESIDSAKVELDAAIEQLQNKYQVMFGDVTGDGEIDVRDATMIQKSIVELTVLDEKQEISSDFNDDADVNVKDATAIQMHIVELD